MWEFGTHNLELVKSKNGNSVGLVANQANFPHPVCIQN